MRILKGASIVLGVLMLAVVGLAALAPDNKPPLAGEMEDMGMLPIVPVHGDYVGSPIGFMTHFTDGYARTLLVDSVTERKKGKREALRTVFNACPDGKWQIVDGKIRVMKYVGRHEDTPEHAYFVQCDK